MKIQPIFVCYAKGHIGMSLIDCVKTSPFLIPLLVRIRIHFQRWPSMLTADISKGFPPDRGAERKLQCTSLPLGRLGP